MISKSYSVKDVFKGNVTSQLGEKKEDVIVKLDLVSTWKRGDLVVEDFIPVILNVDNLSDNFKLISDVTEQDLIDWALDTVPDKRIDSFERRILKKLESLEQSKKNPKPIIEEVSRVYL
jgi:hypothetical protein